MSVIRKVIPQCTFENATQVLKIRQIYKNHRRYQRDLRKLPEWQMQHRKKLYEISQNEGNLHRAGYLV